MPTGSPKQLALCVVSAALGLETFALLTTGCRPVFKPLEKLCLSTLSPEPGRDGVPAYLPLGVPALDSFLCLVTPFFQSATGSPEGLFITRILFRCHAVRTPFMRAASQCRMPWQHQLAWDA